MTLLGGYYGYAYQTKHRRVVCDTRVNFHLTGCRKNKVQAMI